ncbi:16S rRNA (guanine(527)-N(7))-methyltransferase RsmG [Moraxella sp. K23]|uniref:16S rRNA (guanine(527)-N(7))-methyltransferase RsmG n=1 Tax=Moraxella sp. CTOTU49803 TaxID=2953840 RepID=UPI0001B39725|nr:MULTISPECIES: 16S rRNA (guanine(527)-N(7))-methyltransferase RsmG [Moraxella]EEV22153.1 16S rRNA methyltransferase GidB [Enhydrobacter aerosaccus SK60]MDI4480044.1 16S rRNA (guanine(527)-N(7))-methyltransferase RsmG [Moraxella osloensis]MDK1669223.1 16S rRNA (guanine(527)-N(7))-methyltransferase RsmG [Moraxella osloensis]
MAQINVKLQPQYVKLQPQLQQALSELKLPLSDEQQLQLLYYLQQLLFWNKAYNLTAIKDDQQALIKHIFDSLSIVPFLPAGDLLDIGTGAGLPAVIVAICQPQRAVTALDSNQKKIRFIKQVASELGLKNLTPVASRIEAHEGTYQVITSRAFASLVDFVTHSQSKLADNGIICAMKGVEPIDEIQALQNEWQINTQVLTVPKLYESRHLIYLQR